jgi:hypothetical protein
VEEIDRKNGYFRTSLSPVRNEYQEYFLGGKPYHFHVPIVLKSGSLNRLEPSGPVQACNGIALLTPVTCNLVEEEKGLQDDAEKCREYDKT